MHLPQFHRTKENDEWWGEGFTDWVSARNAKPLFDGHYQPHEPLEDNYYNFLDKSTMKWQAELAKKYGVDGFCFYHYWFMNGKTILEKPAENLLEWDDINIEFCFSWDSNAWVQSWSRMNFNYSWDVNSEGQHVKNGSGILIDQKFGREYEWKKHFNYLLPFFMDKRYIKKDGKPVFLFYAAKNIYCLDDMLECWNEWAVCAGLDGIYSIVTNDNEKMWDNVDASLIQLPSAIIPKMISAQECTITEYAKVFDIEKLWERATKIEHEKNRKVYYGALVGFDDSPRRKPGNIFKGSTPELFETHLKQMLLKNYCKGNEFTFVNAWNEWGEGMHLEPDKLHGFAYLDAVKNAQELFLEQNKDWTPNKEDLLYEEDDTKLFKMNEYFSLMNEWMFKLEDGKAVASYFIKNNFKKIAVYGYGHIAKHLLFQLQGHDVKIEYIIEQFKSQNSVPYPTKTVSDDLEQVDVVVVTPIVEYSEIKKSVKERINCPIVSIKEVVFES